MNFFLYSSNSLGVKLYNLPFTLPIIKKYPVIKYYLNCALTIFMLYLGRKKHLFNQSGQLLGNYYVNLRNDFRRNSTRKLFMYRNDKVGFKLSS